MTGRAGLPSGDAYARQANEPVPPLDHGARAAPRLCVDGSRVAFDRDWLAEGTRGQQLMNQAAAVSAAAPRPGVSNIDRSLLRCDGSGQLYPHPFQNQVDAGRHGTGVITRLKLQNFRTQSLCSRRNPSTGNCFFHSIPWHSGASDEQVQAWVHSTRAFRLLTETSGTRALASASAASLARRRAFNRAVFSAVARLAASYSAKAFAPSRA